MKRISPVFDPENAEQEAVHYEYDTAPGEGSNLLSLWIRHPGHFERESNSGKRESAVYDWLASGQ